MRSATNAALVVRQKTPYVRLVIAVIVSNLLKGKLLRNARHTNVHNKLEIKHNHR